MFEGFENVLKMLLRRLELAIDKGVHGPIATARSLRMSCSVLSMSTPSRNFGPA